MRRRAFSSVRFRLRSLALRRKILLFTRNLRSSTGACFFDLALHTEKRGGFGRFFSVFAESASRHAWSGSSLGFRRQAKTQTQGKGNGGTGPIRLLYG